MPPLPVLKSREIIRALERAGFEQERQAGSHVRMRRGEAHVTIAFHGPKYVSRGTLGGILKQAGLTVDEFLALLKR